MDVEANVLMHVVGKRCFVVNKVTVDHTEQIIAITGKTADLMYDWKK